MCLFSMKIKEMVGKKFGRLKVVELLKVGDRGAEWKCICDCGIVSAKNGYDLRSGTSRSCWCLCRELSSKREKTHGMTKTRFYKCWDGIRERCKNKNSKDYKKYGGRGIKCLWKSFEEFKKDMYHSYLIHFKKHGPKQTSLDRIDVNGHYSKENCQWATQKMQQNNTRVNHLFSFRGKTKTLTEWSRTSLAKKNKLGKELILYRINAGWPEKEILTTMVFSKRHKKL